MARDSAFATLLALRIRRAMTVLMLCAGIAILAAPEAHAQEPSPQLPASAADTQVVAIPELKARLDAMASPPGRLVRGVAIAGFKFLPRLYAAQGYRLLWTDAGRIEQLREQVRRSWEDGLLANDFHEAFVSSHKPPSAADTAAIEGDIILSDAFVRLLYQLYFGKVSPNSLDADWNFARPMLADDPLQTISAAIAAGDIAQLVEKAKVDHPYYRSLKATLQAYAQMDTNGGWSAIPDGAAIKLGASDPRMAALRNRLVITGELDAGGDMSSEVYDETVSAAVAKFQKSHGLEADGVLGAKTLAELNVPVATRIDQIRINLERGRWVLRGLGPDFVAVNIAGYYLRLVFDSKLVWGTRVIVGRSYTKTPIFTGDMKTIVFNPDWAVPRSIARNELFPKASADPAYVAANSYVLKGAEGTADPAMLNWEQYTAATFPYTFVQQPGPKNALGLVKFLFPNKHNVYLHDTPSRGLFAQSGRSFSHGCIRVQDPLKLAELILGNRLGWDRAKIDRIVAAGKMSGVTLTKPLPVLLLYWTVDPEFDGSARFYPDIYARDGKLLSALNAAFKPSVN